MKEHIRHLVRLQEIAFEMHKLEQQRRDGPVRLAALDAEFQERVEEIGGARLRHEALVQERQQLLQERDELSRRLEIGQQKLMQVNNQREYSAVLNEIDLTKARVSELEEMIAERNAEIEELSEPATEADQRIEVEQKKLDEQKQIIEIDRSTIEERLSKLEVGREEIRRQVPNTFIQRFEQIERARGGIAVAPINKTACGACHVKLRPQVINLCRRGADLVTCDSCRRILYVSEPANEDAPTPAGQVAGDSNAPGRPAAGA